MKRLLMVLSLCTTLGTIGCGKKNTKYVNPADMVGTWALDSVRSIDLRYQTNTTEDTTINVGRADSLVLTAGGRYEAIHIYSPDTGVYTVTQNLLTFNHPNGMTMPITSCLPHALILNVTTTDQSFSHTRILFFSK